MDAAEIVGKLIYIEGNSFSEYYSFGEHLCFFLWAACMKFYGAEELDCAVWVYIGEMDIRVEKK